MGFSVFFFLFLRRKTHKHKHAVTQPASGHIFRHISSSSAEASSPGCGRCERLLYLAIAITWLTLEGERWGGRVGGEWSTKPGISEGGGNTWWAKRSKHLFVFSSQGGWIATTKPQQETCKLFPNNNHDQTFKTLGSLKIC